MNRDGFGNVVSRGSLDRNYLSCLYTNPTSLGTNKVLDLERDLIIGNREDLLFFTETWFKDYFIVNIDKYVINMRDRKSRDKKSEDGVAIYVRHDLFTSEVADEILRNQIEKLIFEHLRCMVPVGKERLLLGYVYRPKESRGAFCYESEIRKFTSLAKKAVDAKKYSRLLIFGDLTFGMLSGPKTVLLMC